MKKIAIICLLFTFLMPCNIAYASDVRQDVIYYIDVDRFVDADLENNSDVSKGDLSSLQGGDFKGIATQLDYIQEMGFGAIYLSPVVDSNRAIPTHFGTQTELKDLVKKANDKELQVFLTYDNATLLSPTEDLAKQVGAEVFDNILIETETTTILQEAFANSDTEMESVLNLQKLNKKSPITIDGPSASRFTSNIVAAKKYPGTRWQLALTYLYTSASPMIYYGSESALNGGAPPANQQIMNFSDKTLVDYITKLASIRTQFSAISDGKTNYVAEQDGMIVYERSTTNQQVIVAINNSSKTNTMTLGKDVIGAEKELRGNLENYRIQSDKAGLYRITLEPETAEIFIVGAETGINWWWMIAPLALFTVFGGLMVYFKKHGQRETK